MIIGSERLYVVASSSQGLTQDTCTPGCSDAPANRGESEFVAQVIISAPWIASSTLLASTTSARTLPRISWTKRWRDAGVGLKILTFLRSRAIQSVTR